MTNDIEWSEGDRRDVAVWLIREADQRVKFFPQRRDGVDALMRHVARDLLTPALKPTGSPDPGRAEFCAAPGLELLGSMEQMGIEDADLSDGRMLADTVYCLGYRLNRPADAAGDDRG